MNRLKEFLFHHFEKIILGVIVLVALIVSIDSLATIIGRKTNPQRYEEIKRKVRTIIDENEPPPEFGNEPLPEKKAEPADKADISELNRWFFYNKPVRKGKKTPFDEHNCEDWFALVNGEYRCLVCGKSGGIRWIFKPPMIVDHMLRVKRSSVSIAWKSSDMNSVVDDKIKSNIYRIPTAAKNKLLEKKLNGLLQTAFGGLKEGAVPKKKDELTTEEFFEQKLAAAFSDPAEEKAEVPQTREYQRQRFFRNFGYNKEKYRAKVMALFLSQPPQKKLAAAALSERKIYLLFIRGIIDTLNDSIQDMMAELTVNAGRKPLNEKPLSVVEKTAEKKTPEKNKEKTEVKPDTSELFDRLDKMVQENEAENETNEPADNAKKPEDAATKTQDTSPAAQSIYQYTDSATEPLKYYTYIIEQVAQKRIQGSDTEKGSKKAAKSDDSKAAVTYKNVRLFCPAFVDVVTPSTLRFWLRGAIKIDGKYQANIEIARYFKPQERWYLKTVTGVKSGDRIGKTARIFLKDTSGKILRKKTVSKELWEKIKKHFKGSAANMLRLDMDFYTGYSLIKVSEGKKKIMVKQKKTVLENGQPRTIWEKKEVVKEGLYMEIKNDLTGEKSIRWQTRGRDLVEDEE